MNLTRIARTILLGGVVLTLAGCVQEVERATPTPTSSPATPILTPTATPTPTFTPTPPPTSTPAPTPIPQLFLDVRGPASNITVQNGSVVVHGATSVGATVTINGNAVSVDRDGEFQAEVQLLPGENLIEVVARGAAGQSPIGKALTITFLAPSSLPFLLVITQPEDQSILSSRTISLSGQTAAGAVLSVNGVGVAVEMNGAFSTMVTLEPGPNIIDIVATNPDGRVLSAVIAVIFRP